VADWEFAVMFPGQSGCGSERVGAAGRNHLVEFPAEEPGSGGVHAVGEPHGLDGHGKFADLVVRDAGRLQLASHARSIAGAVEEHLRELTPREENEGTLIGAVESGDCGGDKATEARALDGDE
jgi:hypothetical protein